MECEFCLNHEQGDTLYESADWDGGIGFDYIYNIKYCPLCGRKLASEDESQIYYKKWETPPKVEPKEEITTCVSVLASALEDESQTEWDARNCISCKYNSWVSKMCNDCNGKYYEAKNEQMDEYIKKEDAIEAVTSIFRVSALFSGMSDNEEEWREKAEKVLANCVSVFASALEIKDEPQIEKEDE